ncbi:MULTISPECIES: SDR family oxidoreductase [Kosakonia]|uniref:SDR family oxidoreductase n=1 Tax=Kosakonia TaxID=1330547 RepID=UPI0005ED8110|nr:MULTISPECIES: SDR family oxidoreductase [Kosakonia]RCX00590.1 3-oxoacyl-[acyl-carrier protein] reductase [Kosakonia sp. AG348]
MSDSWILVTGGNRGIGSAIVNELRSDNNIVFTSRSTKSSPDENNQSSKTFIEHVVCDNCDVVQVETVAKDLLNRYGPPKAVIHNAGVTQDELHIRQSIEQWRNVIDTNLNAIFYWNKYLLPEMMANGDGVILLVSSVTGIKGNIGQTVYGASKAAHFGLARSLALEVARFGIRVNCLAPGVIDSDMTHNLSPDALKKLRSQIPLRRFGSVEEVAKVARFMISEPCQYMTGQTIVLDGGMTA